MLSKLKNKEAGFYILLTILVSLLWTQVYNIGGYFGQEKISDFVDLTVSFADVVSVIIFSKLFINLTNRGKAITGSFFTFGLFQLFINGFIGLNSIYLFVLNFCRIFIITFLIKNFANQINSSKSKIVFYSSIFIFAFFDHLLLSSSIPAIFLFFIYSLVQKNNKPLGNLGRAFCLIIAVNLLLSAYHLIFGKHLGLTYIGERVISADMINVAKIQINNTKILRGYGLYAHPNILGFVSVISFWFLTEIKFLKNIRAFQVVAFFTGLLTISRSAIIGLILNISLLIKNRVVSVIILILLLIGAGLLIFSNQSNIYRFEDIFRFISYYWNSSIFEKLFGIGLGQYSFYLQRLGSFESWQLQPVHNIFLQLIFEIGIIPLIMVDIIISKFKSNKYARKN